MISGEGYCVKPLLDDFLHFHHPLTLRWAVENERRQIIKAMLDQLFSTIERHDIGLIARQQEPTMTRLERGNIVLDQAAQPHYVDGMGAQDMLLVIANRKVKEYAGQKDNDHDAGGGAGKELEMEVLLAKKPREASPKEGKTRAFWLRTTQQFLGFVHYNF